MQVYWSIYATKRDPTDENNDMIKGAGGIYRLSMVRVPTSGSRLFKITPITHLWPADDFTIGVYKTGAFNYEIIFNLYNNDEDKIAVDITEIF